MGHDYTIHAILPEQKHDNNMKISYITFCEVFIYHVYLNKINTAILENLMRIIIENIK